MFPKLRPTRSTVYDSSNQKLWLPRCQKRSAAASAVSSASSASSRLRGTSRGHVEAHVVDLERVAERARHVVHVLLAQILRDQLEERRETDRADVVARL